MERATTILPRAYPVQLPALLEVFRLAPAPGTRTSDELLRAQDHATIRVPKNAGLAL